MAQNDEILTETNPNINTDTETRRNKFRITMELPLFFTLMAVSLSGAVIRNMILYRTCVYSLKHSKEECQGFLSPTKANNTKHLEEEVQKYEAFVSIVRLIIKSLAPACLSLFLGVWSDTHGRKPLIVWPLFGISLSGALTVVYSMLDGFGPWWYVLTVIPMSFTGGFTSLFTGAFCYGTLSSVLDFSLAKEMGQKCFKKRPNHGRAKILLLTFANCLSVFIMYGLMNLEYDYTRTKLNWAIRQYTMYSAVNTTISFLGSFIGVLLVQRIFRVSDLSFSVIAFFSSTIEYVIKASAVTTWYMYLGTGVSLFKRLSSPLMRSMLTKMLPGEDIAKGFALMCAVEAISPLISPALYSSLYVSTIKCFPGAIYILSSGITGLCVLFLGFVQYFIWKGSQGSFQQLEEEDTS